MPTAYGAEFRQDVIDVARKGEAPLAQIAKDFGLSVTTLKRWIAIAERRENRGRAGGGVGRDAGTQEAEPPVGAGERDPAPGCRLPGQGHQPKMTLLWVLSSHDGLELAEDGAADVAFEVPADLPV